MVWFHQPVYIPLAKTVIPTHERSKEWDRLQFSIVEHKDYHECREEIPQRNKALSILVCNVYTAAVFCQEPMLTGERSQVIWLLLLFFSPFSCTIERPCVCVCDLLFDTKQVPFSILYPKLSIPYYIKERTPVDIVFLSLPGDRYIIFTHRDTHAIVICFPVSYFLFFYFRFPGGKITLNVQSCGGHGVRESNDTIFIR